MKRIEKYVTYDGIEHTTYNKAVAHCEEQARKTAREIANSLLSGKLTVWSVENFIIENSDAFAKVHEILQSTNIDE
jgi:hypothetical protein